MSRRIYFGVGDEVVTIGGLKGKIISCDTRPTKGYGFCRGLPVDIYNWKFYWEGENGNKYVITDDIESLKGIHRIGNNVLYGFRNVPVDRLKFVLDTLKEEANGGFIFENMEPDRFVEVWRTIGDYKRWADFYCKEFSALPNGCIFSVSNDDAYLIKIQRIDAGDKPINAIQLKDGSPLYFDDADKVYPSDYYNSIYKFT